MILGKHDIISPIWLYTLPYPTDFGFERITASVYLLTILSTDQVNRLMLGRYRPTACSPSIRNDNEKKSIAIVHVSSIGMNIL